MIVAASLLLLLLLDPAAVADTDAGTVNSKLRRLSDASWLAFKARYGKNYETSGEEISRYN